MGGKGRGYGSRLKRGQPGTECLNHGSIHVRAEEIKSLKFGLQRISNRATKEKNVGLGRETRGRTEFTS